MRDLDPAIFDVLLPAGRNTHPDRVAELLGAMGVKGMLEEACDCPLARWGRAVLDADASDVIEVDSSFRAWNDETPSFNYHAITNLPLPMPLMLFISRFDALYYPWLVVAYEPSPWRQEEALTAVARRY